MNRKRIERSGLGLACWLACMVCAATAAAQSGTTWHVATTGDDAWPGTSEQPFLTIGRGIEAAADGDAVEIHAGVYEGTGNHELDFAGKAIVVRGATGNPEDVLIREWDVSYPHLFGFTSGEDSTSVLRDVTLYSGWGVAIECLDSSPRIDNCRLTAEWIVGPLVLCTRSSPIVSNSRFDGTVLMTIGAAFELYESSSPRITDCVFADLYVDIDAAVVLAGAVSCRSGSNPLLVRCRFQNNSTLDGSGAALACEDSSPTLVDCDFDGNFNDAPYETTKGAAVALRNSSPRFVRCSFTRNGGWGFSLGAIACMDGSNPDLENCTIAGNEDGGGGIYVENASFTARNCIIAFDDAAAFITEGSVQISLQNTDIYGNTGGDWTGPIADLLGVDGNISADPLFCDLSQVDIGLCADSPCLEAINGIGLIGARDAACQPCGPVETEDTSMGAVRSLFR